MRRPRPVTAVPVGRESLQQASLRLAEVESECRLFDDDYQAELSQWVAAGCRGAQPAQDVVRLEEDLARRHEAARRVVVAQERPLNELLQQIAWTTDQVARVQSQIDLEVLATLTKAEHINGWLASFNAVIADAKAIIVEVRGLREFLLETARRAQIQGDPTKATHFSGPPSAYSSSKTRNGVQIGLRVTLRRFGRGSSSG